MSHVESNSAPPLKSKRGAAVRSLGTHANPTRSIGYPNWMHRELARQLRRVSSPARRLVAAHGRTFAAHTAVNSLLIAVGYIYGSAAR